MPATTSYQTFNPVAEPECRRSVGRCKLDGKSHKVCSNPQAAGKYVRRIRYEEDDTAVERV